MHHNIASELRLKLTKQKNLFVHFSPLTFLLDYNKSYECASIGTEKTQVY